MIYPLGYLVLAVIVARLMYQTKYEEGRLADAADAALMGAFWPLTIATAICIRWIAPAIVWVITVGNTRKD